VLDNHLGQVPPMVLTDSRLGRDLFCGLILLPHTWLFCHLLDKFWSGGLGHYTYSYGTLAAGDTSPNPALAATDDPNDRPASGFPARVFNFVL